jgi:hypothetical protein
VSSRPARTILEEKGHAALEVGARAVREVLT